MRIKCLEFVSKRMGSGGVYQAEYGRIGRSEKADLKFLPCVAKSPLDNQEKKGLYSVLTCCSVERCAVMGFPVIDPSLGDTGKLFGSLFQCATEPDPSALIRQLHFLINSAKTSLNASKGAHRKVVSERVVSAFSEIFHYLSSCSSEIGSSLMGGLEAEEFIPCIVNGEVKWSRPNAVFFRSTNDEAGDNITALLFQVVNFSPFLAAAGVKQEASIPDIF
jgi:hypothetical protein